MASDQSIIVTERWSLSNGR